MHPRPPLFCVFVCFSFFFLFFYVQYTTWKQILKLRTKRNGVGSLGNNVDKQQTLLYMNYCDIVRDIVHMYSPITHLCSHAGCMKQSSVLMIWSESIQKFYY